jgi:DNA modification methylase
LDSYLQWFYETVVLLRDLLAEDGSLYVHLDWHVSHYAKQVLDEIFGAESFRNEIIWKRSAIATNVANQWRNSHDVILFYTKSAKNVFHIQYGDYSESSKKHYNKMDTRGVFRTVPLMASGRTGGVSGQPWRGVDVAGRGKNGMHWLKNPSELNRLDDEKLIYWNSEGVPELKYYSDEAKGVYVSDFWDDISVINSMGSESLGYSTQKPEALLERIIKASSNEGDLVLDCFCGSGTTAAVAEKLNRRWITCDLGRFAIHTARKRLLSIPGVQPFVVQNLGKYERQAWQKAEFGDPVAAASLQARYRNFILQLYHASPLEGYSWLHGVKAGKLVHVGSVDAPIALGEVKAIVSEFWRVTGKDAGERRNEVDILGWDFAFDLNETAKQMAADSNIKVSFKKIPREVLEKKAVEQGDIRFYELAALAVDCHQKGRNVNLELKNFFVSPDDIPLDIQQAISNWSQWIDYWAVDWDYQDDTFHNQWQSYRTRKDPKIQLTAGHEYTQPGCYTVVIKVIDILGNDTTKAIQVEVK